MLARLVPVCLVEGDGGHVALGRWRRDGWAWWLLPAVLRQDPRSWACGVARREMLSVSCVRVCVGES